jgi:ribosomal protein S27E
VILDIICAKCKARNVFKHVKTHYKYECVGCGAELVNKKEQ